MIRTFAVIFAIVAIGEGVIALGQMDIDRALIINATALVTAFLAGDLWSKASTLKQLGLKDR